MYASHIRINLPGLPHSILTTSSMLIYIYFKAVDQWTFLLEECNFINFHVAAFVCILWKAQSPWNGDRHVSLLVAWYVPLSHHSNRCPWCHWAQCDLTMETLQLDDVCRVVSPATFRTGRALSSQWICEYPTGTLLKILEFDSSEVGRQRARVQTQLKYIFGWISIRTAGLVYLVEKVDADEATNFDIPEATKLCGLEVDLSFDRLEPESVRAASIHAIDRIKSDPDFISLSQQTLVERIQGRATMVTCGYLYLVVMDVMDVIDVIDVMVTCDPR